jgi:hypothetical protein
MFFSGVPASYRPSGSPARLVFPLLAPSRRGSTRRQRGFFMENANWFLKIGNKVHGPMSPNELRQNARTGLIGPETQICKGTDGQWVRAENVQGLFQSPSLSTTQQNDSRNLVLPPPLPPSVADGAERKKKSEVRAALMLGAISCIGLGLMVAAGMIIDATMTPQQSRFLDPFCQGVLLISFAGIIRAVYVIWTKHDREFWRLGSHKSGGRSWWHPGRDRVE